MPAAAAREHCTLNTMARPVELVYVVPRARDAVTFCQVCPNPKGVGDGNPVPGWFCTVLTRSVLM